MHKTKLLKYITNIMHYVKTRKNDYTYDTMIIKLLKRKICVYRIVTE